MLLVLLLLLLFIPMSVERPWVALLMVGARWRSGRGGGGDGVVLMLVTPVVILVLLIVFTVTRAVRARHRSAVLRFP